jgi:hypothetical protein
MRLVAADVRRLTLLRGMEVRASLRRLLRFRVRRAKICWGAFFQGWDCWIGWSRPEGRLKQDIRWIQPSLRDLRNRESDPGSELPGYSQISLREIGDAGPIVETTGGGYPVSPRRPPDSRHASGLEALDEELPRLERRVRKRFASRLILDGTPQVWFPPRSLCKRLARVTRAPRRLAGAGLIPGGHQQIPARSPSDVFDCRAHDPMLRSGTSTRPIKHVFRREANIG